MNVDGETSCEDTFEKFIQRNDGYDEYIQEIQVIDYSKKYTGVEIISLLKDKILQEGDRVELIQIESGNKLSLLVNKCDENFSLRRESDNHEVGNSFFTSSNCIFKIMPYVQKVDFLTAYEAYLDGAKIQSCQNYSYQDGKVYSEDGHSIGSIVLCKAELNGEWVIIDEEDL